jgi:hypothetical protein
MEATVLVSTTPTISVSALAFNFVRVSLLEDSDDDAKWAKSF